jgi:hypothetical protein
MATEADLAAFEDLKKIIDLALTPPAESVVVEEDVAEEEDDDDDDDDDEEETQCAQCANKKLKSAHTRDGNCRYAASVANGTGGGEGRRGRWLTEEHTLFLHCLRVYGKDWKKCATILKFRSVVQVRTHAEKHFKKVAKETGKLQESTGRGAGEGGDGRGGGEVVCLDIPVSPASLAKVGGNVRELAVVQQHEIGGNAGAPSDARIKRREEEAIARNEAASQRTKKQKKYYTNLIKKEAGFRQKKGRRGGGGDCTRLIEARSSMCTGIGAQSLARELGVTVHKLGAVGSSPDKWLYNRQCGGPLDEALKMEQLDDIFGDALFVCASGANEHQTYLQRSMCQQKYVGAGAGDDKSSTAGCANPANMYSHGGIATQQKRMSEGLVMPGNDDSEARARVSAFKANM